MITMDTMEIKMIVRIEMKLTLTIRIDILIITLTKTGAMGVVLLV